MPTNIRLTKKEQELIRKKCVEINKALIKMNKEPLKDSELVHEILIKSIGYVDVSTKGNIEISN